MAKRQALAPVEDGFVDKNAIKMESVSSSNVDSIGWHEEEVLQVKFVSGAIYQYSPVPEEVYEDLKNAPSIGSYFYYQIRKGGYDFRRVE